MPYSLPDLWQFVQFDLDLLKIRVKIWVVKQTARICVSPSNTITSYYFIEIYVFYYLMITLFILNALMFNF